MPAKINDRILNFASIIDADTIEQAAHVASMPFIHGHVALMPDAHAGKGSAVGTVIPTLGAVMPAAVGVDIGCGMIAVRTSRRWDDLRGVGRLEELRDALIAEIPMSAGNYNTDISRVSHARRVAELEGRADRDGVDLSHSPKWREQIGTLGGGNHFIELCVDQDDVVWLFLHSGSRGVGNKIAQRHIRVAQSIMRRYFIDLPSPDLAYLVEGTDEFATYLRDLYWAQAFALANRDEMMDRFVELFGRATYTNLDSVEVERINCHHNYTVQEKHFGKDVWLTRKGAVNAHKGTRGLVPGSMGDRSYVTVGKGNPAGLCSAPHGAGRLMSRTKAKAAFTESDLAAAMGDIVYRHGDAWIDEIPQAYKPIDQVMEDAADLVEVTHELRQVLNVKGE